MTRREQRLLPRHTPGWSLRDRADMDHALRRGSIRKRFVSRETTFALAKSCRGSNLLATFDGEKRFSSIIDICRHRTVSGVDRSASAASGDRRIINKGPPRKSRPDKPQSLPFWSRLLMNRYTKTCGFYTRAILGGLLRRNKCGSTRRSVRLYSLSSDADCRSLY